LALEIFEQNIFWHRSDGLAKARVDIRSQLMSEHFSPAQSFDEPIGLKGPGVVSITSQGRDRATNVRLVPLKDREHFVFLWVGQRAPIIGCSVTPCPAERILSDIARVLDLSGLIVHGRCSHVP
jgi:hypothetical protein